MVKWQGKSIPLTPILLVKWEETASEWFDRLGSWRLEKRKVWKVVLERGRMNWLGKIVVLPYGVWELQLGSGFSSRHLQLFSQRQRMQTVGFNQDWGLPVSMTTGEKSSRTRSLWRGVIKVMIMGSKLDKEGIKYIYRLV